MSASIRPCGPDLHLIVLSPPIPGFIDFVAAWLVTRPDGVYVVDPGPAVTADQLTAALAALDVTHLDYICLTHIHMDHAGAVGHLARQFPAARVVCHPKGVPHLIDPERLWQGTVKTLGDTGRAYAPMRPVPAARMADEKQLAAAPFDLIDTPGHSPHHYAIAADGYLFAGEAAGVCLPLPGGGHYLRPATPPRFFLETSLASIDRITAVRPERLCYGHFGLQSNAIKLLASHRQQLESWARTLAGPVAEANGGEDEITEWVALMLKKDALLAGFDRLPPAVQQRERGFLRNSIKGFAGYLTERKKF